MCTLDINSWQVRGVARQNALQHMPRKHANLTTCAFNCRIIQTHSRIPSCAKSSAKSRCQTLCGSCTSLPVRICRRSQANVHDNPTHASMRRTFPLPAPPQHAEHPTE